MASNGDILYAPQCHTLYMPHCIICHIMASKEDVTICLTMQLNNIEVVMTSFHDAHMFCFISEGHHFHLSVL